jgi:rhodanese-related sulfurtransferase
MPHPSARRAVAALALAAAFVVGACSPSGAATSAQPSPQPVASGAAGVATLSAEVSVADAFALRTAGAFILDVREPDEWAAGHVPDATLIPLGDLASRVGEVPRDRQVVVICRSGNRSAAGRDILLGAGFPSVTSVAGGMTDWTAAGYPTATGS